MKKRLLLYIVFLLLVGIWVRTVYVKYKPEDAVIINQKNITYDFVKTYTVAEFEELLKTRSSDINVIYFDDNNINCQYFFNNMLPQILSASKTDRLNNVVFVDVSGFDSRNSLVPSKMGFSSIPSMVNLKYEDGNIVIINILSDDGKTRFVSETVTEWLSSHGMIPIVSQN